MPSVVFDAILDSLTINQVTATQWQPNLKHARAYASGALAAAMISVVSGEDVISITTADLAGVIAGINASSGLILSSSSVIPYEARAAGGTFTGDGTHNALTFVNGLLLPVEFSATQDSEEGAVAKLDVHVGAAAGQTYPVTLTTGATLTPSVFVGAYDLGPTKIASARIQGVKSASVKFMITPQKMRYGGEVWPLMYGISILKIEPVLEVTFEDVPSAQSAGVFAATASNAVQYFRKRVPGGAHVADATTTNIACTITGGMHMIQSGDGGEHKNVSLVRQFQGLSWAFSSAAAIT
jgi:hypothetical protein